MLKQNDLFYSQASLQILLNQHVQFLLDKVKQKAFTGECRFAAIAATTVGCLHLGAAEAADGCQHPAGAPELPALRAVGLWQR